MEALLALCCTDSSRSMKAPSRSHMLKLFCCWTAVTLMFQLSRIDGEPTSSADVLAEHQQQHFRSS